AAMEPELPLAVPVAVIDRTIKPAAAEKDRAVIERQVPEIVGATPRIAVPARIEREGNAARRRVIAIVGGRRRQILVVSAVVRVIAVVRRRIVTAVRWRCALVIVIAIGRRIVG